MDAELVTCPNGEPPDGGSKIASTFRSSVCPSGVSTWIGEPATRIELVTEGVLTRRLLGDPELRGVGCVIIDEFHERHLDGDVALAMVARLRERRPELRVVVMSATLDAEPVAAYLGGAPIVRSEGRTFPVAIEFMEQLEA